MPWFARVIFCALGGVAVGIGIKIFLQNRQTQKWNTTKGEIQESAIAGIDEDFIVIKYQYRVKGVQYVGDRFSVSGGSVGNAPQVIESYKPGATVDVIYNPRDPGESALVRDPVAIPIFVIAVGITFILFGSLVSF